MEEKRARELTLRGVRGTAMKMAGNSQEPSSQEPGSQEPGRHSDLFE
jgi:hypothetical protein